MSPFSDLPLALVCFLPVIASTFVGIWVGRRVAPQRRPDKDHVGTIQGALLGLLGLLLGFAFSGSMSRFVDRQQGLAMEANAIEFAYDRAQLLPNAERVRGHLRTYADRRLELFESTVDARGAASSLERDLVAEYDRALAAALEGAREAPQFATIVVTGLEEVNDQFARRNALAHRRLPAEFVVVMLVASCLAMGMIGYGVGLAERRSVISAVILSLLISATLFMTFDFDRPRRGLVRLDATPLRQTVHTLRGLDAAP